MRLVGTPEVRVQEDVLRSLGEWVERFDAQRVLLVTSEGGAKRWGDAVRDATGNVELAIFSDVEAEPSLETGRRAGETAREIQADLVIGLGGGSPLDICKVAAAQVHNRGDLTDMIGVDQIRHRVPPIIAIPTTAGTGSETTPVAIVTDKADQLKKGIVSTRIIPAVALLDPTLSVTMPSHITAWTGVDALTHALEAYTSRPANDFTDSLAMRAVRMIFDNLPRAFEQGDDLDARREMLVASLLAGMAFASSGCAAVHALAMTLGGRYPLAHGLANALMLPSVMEFNREVCEEKYDRLAARLGIEGGAAGLVDRVIDLCDQLQIPERLSDVGVEQAALEPMARAAVEIKRLMEKNPREMSWQQALELYESVF